MAPLINHSIQRILFIDFSRVFVNFKGIISLVKYSIRLQAHGIICCIISHYAHGKKELKYDGKKEQVNLVCGMFGGEAMDT